MCAWNHSHQQWLLKNNADWLQQKLTEGDQCPRGSPSFNKGRLVQVSLTIHINQNQTLLCTFGCMVTMVKPQSEHGLRHLACSDDDGWSASKSVEAAKDRHGQNAAGWMEYLNETKLGEVLGLLAAPTPTHICQRGACVPLACLSISLFQCHGTGVCSKPYSRPYCSQSLLAVGWCNYILKAMAMKLLDWCNRGLWSSNL
jgi:hypothetical protein